MLLEVSEIGIVRECPLNSVTHMLDCRMCQHQRGERFINVNDLPVSMTCKHPAAVDPTDDSLYKLETV